MVSVDLLKPKRIDLSQKALKPLSSKKNILVTAALPYVNNVPHLGNIVGCVLSADVFARFSKLDNANVLFICGTDEYGTATEVKAIQQGKTSAEICEEYHAKHKQIYDYFNIDFSSFGRTSTEKQTEITQSIFKKSFENGHMVKKSVEELYCSTCKISLADRYIEGTCPKCGDLKARGDQCDSCLSLMNPMDLINAKCQVCKNEPVKQPTDHIYFDLPQLEKDISECFPESESQWSNCAHEIYTGWLKNKLEQRCITRGLKWGTKVPEFADVGDKVFYVWYDAPIGYISITANYLPDTWQTWWKTDQHGEGADVKYVQFMAKDNVPFHSIFFPGTLLSTRQPWKLVDCLSGTHYLLYEDQKFSKSNNVGIFGDQVKDLIDFDVDFLRLYLMYIRPEGRDSNFKWDAFFDFYSNVVLANVGNLVNRCLSFTYKNFEDKIPSFSWQHAGELEKDTVTQIDGLFQKYKSKMWEQKLNAGLRIAFEISSIGNVYFNDSAPWVKVKNAELRDELENCLSLTCSIIFFLSTILEPFGPNISQQIRKNFSVEESSFGYYENFSPFDMNDFKLKKPNILVKKYTRTEISDLMKKFESFKASK